MTGTVLERSLINVAVRIQKLRILRKQALVWIVLLLPAIVLTLALPRRGGLMRPEVLVVLATTVVGSILARLLARQPSRSEAARLVEQANPELNDAIITAVQVSEQSGRRPSVLAAMAIQEADSLAKRKDWSSVVPGRQIAGWTLVSFLSFVAMVSSVMAASRYGRDLVGPKTPEAIAEAEQKVKEQITELVIEPGHTEIERGSALTVVAKFPGVVPTHAVLEFADAQKNIRQMAMTETVDAGVFAARMEDITVDGTYRVLYDNSDRSAPVPADTTKSSAEFSESFRVTTFVRPRLEQVNVVITPPAWSKRPSETIEDVVRVSVIEGSMVNFKLLLNKPVARAELRPKEGPAIVLTPSAEQPAVAAQPAQPTASSADTADTASAAAPEATTVGAIVETTVLALESNAWTVYLEDAQGRTPADEEQIAIRVTTNERPKLKVTFPGRDSNVSPLQEFQIEATASDDFELVDYGVQFSISGAEPQDLALKPTSAVTVATTASSDAPSTEPAANAEPSAGAETSSPEPQRNATLSHTIALEQLNAAPDDMVTYSFWATDIDVDGQPRQVYSDIMFAEVRRFEEIMREAQQQGQQQQQQQQQSQQQQQQGSPIDGLLNLQKEILSATWNTIRAESQVRKDGSFAGDVATIAQSQAQAIEQLSEATAEAASDPKVAALAQRAAEEMAAAQKKLEEVAAGTEAARLSQALPLEQSVLQTLLKMRAAETNVRQQQQGGGGGGGGGGSASQQQMQQLELDNSRNRYQSEQQAQPQQEMTQQQREQLQVLNRLKELARRQQMVNERLKQLESELRAALTEKEKEEIERELKRLREEQREMLRDVDELAERMDQATDPQNAQSSEMKQQLQEARENVQQASRAMDDGKLSEAISEGTRAERQFEELKEDFRNQTSSQFEEAVKDLRQQARELSEKQDEVAKQLAGESTEGEQKSRPSLKSDRNREETQKQLSEQKDRLNRVVEQTKQMIEQAEQTEPLLSNTLYETIRQLKDSRPEEALDAAETLAGRGLWQQSQQAEQAARQGIEQLKSGIEKAADSVLGSEAESLRRAQQQLEEATQKLAGEVASATGEEPKQDGDGEESKERSTAGGESEPTDSKQKGRSRSGQDGSEDQKSGDGKEGKSGRGRQGKQDPSEKGQKQSGEGASGEGEKQAEDGEAGSEGQSEESEKQGEGAGQNKQSGGSGQDGKQSDQEQNEQDQDGKKGGQKGGEQGGKQGGSGPGGGQQGDQEPADGEPSKEGSDDSPADGDKSDQQRGEGSQRGGNERQSSLRNGGRENRGGQREGMGRGGFDTGARPLTGDDYSEWSDQMRDIEEMLDDPELRNRVAQVRDRAKAMRAEYKRHGEMPQWDLVKSQLLGEMQLLQQRIDQEVSRLQSDRAMVPIDREPVPEEFDSLVQRYYELLGQEKEEEAKRK